MKHLIETLVLSIVLAIGWNLQASAMSVNGESAEFEGTLTFAQPAEGVWNLNEGRWQYQESGKAVRSRWLCIVGTDGKRDWYCFDAQGYMCTGWQKSSSGNWYYLRETKDERMGAMEHGFLLEPTDGRIYYLDPDTGIMRTGWVRIEGKSYYFANTSDGGSSWYWDGIRQKWVYDGQGKRPLGSMYANEYTPDGKWVDSRGVCKEK